MAGLKWGCEGGGVREQVEEAEKGVDCFISLGEEEMEGGG